MAAEQVVSCGVNRMVRIQPAIREAAEQQASAPLGLRKGHCLCRIYIHYRQPLRLAHLGRR